MDPRLGKRLAIGLREIENVGGLEADDGLLLVGLCRLSFGVLEDHRRENEDAFLAFADGAANGKRLLEGQPLVTLKAPRE